LASTWDLALARTAGAMIGREAHVKGFNVLLAGGVNLTRDPRGGRNFEYLGEDPLLAGLMAGASIDGIQSEHVVSTVKHFVLNAYETGRNYHNTVIGEAALRESDLLAFQLAIERGRPGSVMCSYNKVNTVYACENEHLLGQVLKGDWGFPGWVMSDWGAVHSVNAARVLDHQSGEQLDKEVYFGEPLRKAVEAGKLPAARIGDMARRMLRSMFANGLFDHPAGSGTIDAAAHAQVSRRAAADGIVLLRNENGLLPLAAGPRRIAIIGGNAAIGVLSGGGSTQVTPSNGTPYVEHLGAVGQFESMFRKMYWFGPAPVTAIRERAGKEATITFDDGRYITSAVEAARNADIAIVFATQWSGENEDLPDLSLPRGQDALIDAVASVNPRTVVVLETGNPVAMPWLARTGAVLQAWYPGQEGAAAIADVLFGQVNPSGRLPMTYPQSEQQLPRVALPGLGMRPDQAFDIEFNEGADVGYRWFARTGAHPLFPFGYGLSYTSFDVSGLKVTGGKTLTVSFEFTNTGSRAGAGVPQIYLRRAAGKPQTRLLGWDKVRLAPGERKSISVHVDPRLLASFDPALNRWRVDAGTYQVSLGQHADDRRLTAEAHVAASTLAP
jgi:beta-glucosidase